MENKHKLGQYFTTNEKLKETVFEFIKNDLNNLNILEPSVGRGDLVQYVIKKNHELSLKNENNENNEKNKNNKKNKKNGNNKKKNDKHINNITFDMYEIDQSIEILPEIYKEKIIYGDFLTQQIDKKYKTIIGNPPFVRIKKGNLYIEFIAKCYELLEFDGELIFIVPSDFLKLTCAGKLLNILLSNGMITDIYHPNNDNLFLNAVIDVIVFRYCKNHNLPKIVNYNNQKKYINNTNGIITFSNNELNELNEKILIKDHFHVCVGIVSGCDEVFKNEELGNIFVINGENKLEKYIYVDNIKEKENEKINQYLLENKEKLLKRQIRKFNENNWYEWGALRNTKIVHENFGKECIYIHNLSRRKNIAFKGTVNNFGGGLIMLLQKNENSLENFSLDDLVAYLNTDEFKFNYTYSRRFTIGHKQISNIDIQQQQWLRATASNSTRSADADP